MNWLGKLRKIHHRRVELVQEPEGQEQLSGLLKLKKTKEKATSSILLENGQTKSQEVDQTGGGSFLLSLSFRITEKAQLYERLCMSPLWFCR